MLSRTAFEHHLPPGDLLVTSTPPCEASTPLDNVESMWRISVKPLAAESAVLPVAASGLLQGRSHKLRMAPAHLTLHDRLSSHSATMPPVVGSSSQKTRGKSSRISSGIRDDLQVLSSCRQCDESNTKHVHDHYNAIDLFILWDDPHSEARRSQSKQPK